MERIYPTSRLLARYYDAFRPWPTDLDVHVVLDLHPGYALMVAPSVARPYLIVTLNLCPLYLGDLLRFQPEGLAAFSDAYDLEKIGHALAEIAAGNQVYLGPKTLETGLTPREGEVVRLAALGCDNLEVARELSVSEKTVRNVIPGILLKLGLKDRVELCYYYLGILPDLKGGRPG